MKDENNKIKLENLVRDIRMGSEEATREMVQYFTPCINKKCRKYYTATYDFDDLKSECIQTLLYCIEKYNLNAGCFYTYACRSFDNKLKYLLRKSLMDGKKAEKMLGQEEEIEDLSSVDNEIWKGQVIDLALDAIENLEENERVVIYLLYYKEERICDIAKEFKLPFHKIQYIRDVALRKIRGIMKEAEAI